MYKITERVSLVPYYNLKLASHLSIGYTVADVLAVRADADALGA